LAINESWELADLARAMILVGLTIRELHEMEEELRGQHELIIGLEELTRLTRGRSSRPYHKRGLSRKGVWITVHLPAGLLAHVATYARMNGRSRNDALAMLLRDGMLCYSTGYNRFLKALTAKTRISNG
jgi:predicted HTH transcriptional regulator